MDPLVSLMMVEKVPDSTYEMVGGLDKQIKEIKEVIELPVKHPELFEALGIAQPKVGALCFPSSPFFESFTNNAFCCSLHHSGKSKAGAVTPCRYTLSTPKLTVCWKP